MGVMNTERKHYIQGRLTDDEHRALRVFSALEHVTVGQFVREAILERIERIEVDTPRKSGESHRA